jgi:hypothetical protein
MAVFTAGRLTAGSLLLTAPLARWVPLTCICLLFSSADRPRCVKTEHWANVRGRPLGLEFDKNGDLIVADALKGLFALRPTFSPGKKRSRVLTRARPHLPGLLHVNSTSKVVTILSHYAEGRNINFADVRPPQNGTASSTLLC